MDKTRVKALQTKISSQYREVGSILMKLLDRDGLLRGRNWLAADSKADWMPAAEHAAGYWVVIAEAFETVHALNAATASFLHLCEKAPDVEPSDDMELQAREGLEEAKVKSLLATPEEGNEQSVSETKLELAIASMCDTATELADDIRNCFKQITAKPTKSILSAEVLPVFTEFYQMATATAAAMLNCRLPAPDSNFKAAAKDLVDSLEAFAPVYNELQKA